MLIPCWRTVTLAACLTAIAAAAARGSIRDGFETPHTAWEIRDRDCALRVVRHERVFQESHSGSGAEHLELVAGRGTYVHITYSIEPSRLHPELVPRVWIKSDRPGLRLMARVVFPRSRDPRTGQPLSVIVPGDVYNQTSAWQQLSVTNIPLLMQRQARSLRVQSLEVDERQAYVDMLVLNGYGGLDRTRIWIDDLEVSGHVEGDAAPRRVVAGTSTVELRGDMLHVDGTPVFVRMVRYRGEPLNQLSELGFNTIYVSTPPTADLLQAARAADLWVVAAPPRRPTQGPPPERLLAWTLGDRLRDKDLESTRRRAEATRLATTQPRPVVADVAGPVSRYSRVLDGLIVGRHVRGTSLEFSEQTRWLRRQANLSRVETPFWLRLNLEASPAWHEQLRSLGHPAPEQLTPSLQQARLELYSGLAAGVRGLLVDTQRPLHLSDPATSLRRSLLRMLNHEVQLLEPWLAGGRAAAVAHRSDRVQVTRIDTDRSQLLIAVQQAARQQLVEAALDSEPLSLVSSLSSSSTDAYRLGWDGLQPLRTRRVPGGVHLPIADPQPIELAVLTQDPLVLSHVTRILQANRAAMSRLRLEFAFQWTGLTAEIDRRLARSGHPLPEAQQWFAEADAALRQAQQLAEARDYARAAAQTRLVLRRLSQVRRGHWEQSVRQMSDPLSSPCCLAFESLPQHWEVAHRAAQGTWGPNLLGGGNLESRDSVESFGWQNRRHPSPRLLTAVSFEQQQPRSGQASLRLSSRRQDPRQPAALESPAVTIQSAPVEVRRGQLLRIQCWVRLPESSAGGELLVYDSFGGRDLALRVQQAPRWQPLVFYRVATEPSPLTVTWELLGVGEAWIDEVSVCALTPKRPVPQE